MSQDTTEVTVIFQSWIKKPKDQNPNQWGLVELKEWKTWVQRCADNPFSEGKKKSSDLYCLPILMV